MAVARGDVRMTDADSANPDEHLIVLWLAQLHRLDVDWRVEFPLDRGLYVHPVPLDPRQRCRLGLVLIVLDAREERPGQLRT